MPGVVYLNGEYLPRERATLSVDDRGFIFGDGIYEVTRVVNGQLFEADRHMRRLQYGLRGIGIDPRLTPETPLAEQGPVRIWSTTDRTSAEVPPHLTGCQVTFRHRINAEETDIEGIIKTVNEELIPGLREMDGFVLYGWLGTSDGRISFNIWETPEQLAAGDAYVADFVATHPIITTNGTTDVYAGTIGYADVLGPE